MLVVGCLAGFVSWLVVCSLGQLDQLIDQSVGWWISPSDGLRCVRQSFGRSVCQSVDQLAGCWVGFLVSQSVDHSLARSVGRSIGWLLGRFVVGGWFGEYLIVRLLG